MPRNRIIHNVQDVFIGSFPDETFASIAGAVGKQVLQRVERVQSFSYNIEDGLAQNTVLGKSHNVARTQNSPPQISLNLKCHTYGVNNEQRFGFNVDTDSSLGSEKGKNIFHNMALKETEGRNVYLVINNKTYDLHHGNETPYPEVLLYKTEFQEIDVIDPNSKDYSVVVFQNCYIDSYNINGSVGALTSMDVNFTADNLIAYSSASGINIPYLDLKKGEVTDTVASVYTSDFSDAGSSTTDGFDGWIDRNVALNRTNCPNDCALVVIANGLEQYHRVTKDLVAIKQNIKYKVTAQVLVPANAPNVKGFQFRYSNGHSGPLIHPTLGEWYDFSYEFVPDTVADSYDGWIEFWLTNSSTVDTSSTFNWAGAAANADFINVKDIVVTEVKEFIIPNHFNRSDSCYDEQKLLSKPENISIDISRSSVEGMSFQTNNIQNFSMSCPVGRTTLDYAGYKMHAGRPVVYPVESQLSLSLLTHEIPTGSFLDNANSEDEYNIVVSCKDKDSESLATYTILGAKFISRANDGSIGENSTETLDFSTSMDFEDKTKGVFLAGSVDAVCASLIWHDDDANQDYTLIADNGDNIIYAGGIYPRY